MRWNKKNYNVNIGDTRVIHKFLWFPKCLYGYWAWLEKAWIYQVYDKRYNWFGELPPKWHDVGWNY